MSNEVMYGLSAQGVDFGAALQAMTAHRKVKLPEWGGYWFKSAGKIMNSPHHTAYGESQEAEAGRIKQYIFRTDWIIL